MKFGKPRRKTKKVVKTRGKPESRYTVRERI